MASAAGLVEKATSDLLIGPDWAMNLDICDVINGDPGQAKDVVKAVKKRLNNKNPRVQLLALTVLETLIKNCGDIVHQQVAEKDVLHEMTKTVKKKSDMQVRDKILVLLDSWQEAFGGSRGKYPQYYMAFEELRRSGVEFPDRAPEHNVPIFTPPRMQSVGQLHGHNSPVAAPHVSPRGEAAVSAEPSGMSLGDIVAARSGVEVLSEMLNAINPRDKGAVVDEVIVDLLEQSRTNQKRVMHLVNTTSDEELLRQALSLNDELQRVIAKHDAIATGSPLPRDPSVPAGHRFDHEEEGEDDFAQLAHRPSSRTRPAAQGTTQSKPGPQAALPPPPGVKKLNVTPSQKAMSVDLLSGDSYQDASPQAPPPSAPPPSAPLPSAPPQSSALASLSFPSQSLSSNPFDSDPAFQALPALPAPTDPQPSYLASGHQPQQQQQPQPYSYNNGLNDPTSPPPYGYQGYAQQPFQQGYVVPWAAPSISTQQQPSLYGQGSQTLNAGLQSQGGGYPQVSSPWGANSLPHMDQQQYAQQEMTQQQQQQMSPQQRAMLYGNTNTGNNNGSNVGGPPLPPPPGQYSLRQQYFQQKQQQGYPSPSTSDLAGQTQSLSLQDQSRYPQNQYNMPGQSLQQAALQPQQQQQQPAKEVKPTDKLFEDLVDLSNPNSRFRTAGILSKPSKAGSM